eukprot:scaffold91531_cov31-Attheya_sp.AAC.1
MEGDEGGGGSRSRTGSSSSVVKTLSTISADVSTSLEAGTSSNNVSVVHTGHEEADLSVITSTTENDAVEETDPSPGEEESAANQIMVYSKWSEVLQSPSEGDAFSPSREMNRKESLHGIGLTVAIDRAKIVARSGKRCASLLSEVA